MKEKTRTYVFPSTTVLPPLPSITTSIVVPIFSNSVVLTVGNVILRTPAATAVVTLGVMSIGDWVLERAQAELFTDRDAQFVLFSGISEVSM